MVPESWPSRKRKSKKKIENKRENKRKEVGLFRAVTQPLKNAFGWVVLTQVRSGLMTQHHKCILDHDLNCGEVAL